MKIKLIIGGILSVTATALFGQSTFTRITDGDLPNDPVGSAGSVWGDFNNDGLLDIFVCHYGATNAFYVNAGGLTFDRTVQGDPFQDQDLHVCAAAADYDNDGSLDLIVSAGTFGSTARPNMLYHNDGDGTLRRASGGIVTNQLGFFGSCNWADYDNDGFVDLFVTYGGDANGNVGKNMLFHNNRDGTFRRITVSPIVNDSSSGMGCALWADYDGDGFMDLFVSSADGTNFLYHNNKGTFERVLTNLVAQDSFGANSAAWGDYDNDGLPDLFVTGQAGINRLYHNNGRGVFASVTNVTSAPMLFINPDATPNGAAWGDYDNDGYLDLIVTSIDAPNALYHNNGDGTFTQILTGDPVNDGGLGISTDSCAWVDYDNDGFLDLSITRHSGDSTVAPILLYHNDGNTNAWLEFRLVGTLSNRSAIGAKVRLKATIGGKTFWQMREITTGGGWNVVPLVAHFGLGDATNADVVRIEWPSGTVQQFNNVPAKRILTITEPPLLSASKLNGVLQFSLKGGRGLQYDIQSTADLKTWSYIGSVIVTNVDGSFLISDTNAPGSPARFYRALSH